MWTMGKKIHDFGNDKMYKEQSANDYFSEDNQTVGEWYGKISEVWGVKNKDVTEEDFQAVMRHRCPWEADRPALTPAVGADGISYYPFQCSAQKSVSIMAMIAGDKRLLDAHKECVKKALDQLETFAAYRVRTGADRTSDKTEITGKILAAMYTHDTSRALDPQIHTHCNIANVTMTADGRRMALTESQMMTAVEYAGRFYQSAMSKKCMELGYKINVKRGRKGIEGFEIDGVSDDMLRKFSRRRAEIENEITRFMKEHGREPSAAEIAVITLETREAKLKEISTPEVLQQMRELLTPEERQQLTEIRKKAYCSTYKDMSQKGKTKLALQAIESVYERKTVVPRHELYSEALKWGMGRLSVEDLAPIIEAKLVKLSEGVNDLSALYTTPRWLDLEKSAVRTINDGVNRHPQFGIRPDAAKLRKLSDDQRRAVEGVLSCRDYAVIVRGAAGAGKTTALRTLDAGLAAAGRDVKYLAPTRGAVNVLKQDGFANATTVASFLLRPGKLSKNTVLVVDEGSLVSGLTGAHLFRIASASGARLIINGDEKQHTSVDAGDFMRMLETSAKVQKYELLEIKRQIPENYRMAIRAMATGRPAEGLQLLNGMGAVTEAKAEYLMAAASAYVSGLSAGKKMMLVSPTHAEIDAMTDLVRDKLRKQNVLDPDAGHVRKTYCDFGLTKSQLSSAASYKPGMVCRWNSSDGSVDAGSVRTVAAVRDDLVIFSDRSVRPAYNLKDTVSLGEIRNIEITPGEKLLITANDKAAGLTNGDVVTVRQVDPDGTVHLTNGKTIPAAFDSFSYGYATTSHKSQGATTQEVILAAATLNDKACYVGSSRGRESVKVICPEFKVLLRSVQKNTDRMTVHEAEQFDRALQDDIRERASRPPAPPLPDHKPTNQKRRGHELVGILDPDNKQRQEEKTKGRTL